MKFSEFDYVYLMLSFFRKRMSKSRNKKTTHTTFKNLTSKAVNELNY